ncbi:hypothetical protein P4O66_007142 [Electrophorus voltai]|uniref:PSI domain-containing protein n=1 Tax=Electrophorus voltai TaxID=2609070 RepID=A0AAD8ZJU8_9TELE|nr:hypothetical protein P4O66_007142 [Electrophorus voltai]
MVVLLSLTWLLLEMLLSDWLTAVLSRDFTLKDIVQLHLSATPYPGSFKCFICEEADDNYSCNRWAPDTYCPKCIHTCTTWSALPAVRETCNLPVPWNETTAIFSTKYPLNRESRICPSSATTITIIILTLGFS